MLTGELNARRTITRRVKEPNNNNNNNNNNNSCQFLQSVFTVHTVQDYQPRITLAQFTLYVHGMYRYVINIRD